MAVELATAYVNLAASAKGISSSIEKELGAPLRAAGDKAGEDASRSFGSKFASGMKVVAKAAGLAGAAAGAFGVKAVLSASDLAETMSKVGVVFGDQQKIVTNFANRMAKDFGAPKREILDAASSIGLIGKASGLSQGDAAKMSTQLGKLAADASSFYNVPLPEALQAIQSGLVGEAEPMRRFGVLLNAQAVDAEAARLGLEKVGKEYTEGAKAQARASLIMSGMKDASGDLERTQGSLANRIKELKGRAANFAADLGTRLLPVVLKGMNLFERWSGIISAKVAPIIKEVGGGVRAFFAAFRDGGNDVTSSGLAGALEKIGIIARNVFDWMKANVLPVLGKVADFIKANLVPVFAGFGVLLGGAVLGAVISLTLAVGALLSPFVLITIGIAGAVAAVVYAYNRFQVFRDVLATVAGFIAGTVAPAVATLAGYLVDKLGDAVGWVKRIWPQIAEAVGHVMTVVKTIIETAVGVISAMWRAWGDDLLGLARTAFEHIRGTIDNVLQVIRGVIATVLAIINGDWGRAWDGIKQVFAGVWDQIVNVLRTAIGILGSVIGGIVSAFAEVLRPLGNLLHTWIISPLEKVIGFVTGMPGKIASAASGMFDGIKNAFRSAINFIIRGWNRLEFKIPGFDPPGPGPSFGGATIGVPNIPTLHSGGIFRAPTPGGEGLALLKDRELVLAAGAKLPDSRPAVVFTEGAVQVAVQGSPGMDEALLARLTRDAVEESYRELVRAMRAGVR